MTDSAVPGQVRELHAVSDREGMNFQAGAADLALPVRRRSGPPPGGRELHEVSDRGGYFNQPRRLKYHIGTTALAAIRISAYG